MRLMSLLHVLALVFWIGGMAFVHFALRPALGETLEPPQRLAVLLAIMRRFFAGVTLAVVVILVTGGVMMVQAPVAGRPAVHVMAGLGVLMALVFAYIRMRSYPALRTAVSAGTWPAAAAAATTIRRLVAFNLGVGVVVIAVALLGR